MSQDLLTPSQLGQPVANNIQKMLNPKTVALIGATEREGSVGKAIMENLLLGKDKRGIYAVNPNRKSVMGLKCYPNIASIQEHVDLAVIATPSTTVPSIVEDCAKAGVDGALIISAGFREIGEEGVKLENELKQIQTKYGIRIFGPNCVGFIRPHINLNTTFLRDNPEPGPIAFISQSGALGSAILDWALNTHIGFGMFASLGSMLDIDYGDLIDYLGEDPKIRSIILYMESVGNAKKFMSATRGFARTKPIIVIKAGKHPAGAKAASSHTGALAGDYQVYDAAFKRAGVIRVDEIEDLFNCASVLESKYLPQGSRLAIVTNAGGPAVLASDFVADYGVDLANLSDESQKSLDANLPKYWSHGNPVDILGDADVHRYEIGLKTCLEDPNVDGLVVIYTPQGSASSMEVADVTAKIATNRRKPVLTVWMGEKSVAEARQVFYKNNVPTYPAPEPAVRTYMYMYRYKRNLDLLYQTPERLDVDIAPPKGHLKVMIRKASKEGRKMLSQAEADKFLDAYGISRLDGGFAENAEDALLVASNIGYPVVIKVVSQDIIHKTDVGGVIPGIQNSQELEEAFAKLMEAVKKAKPDAKIDGVYVQRMAKDIEYELILGSKTDRDFGAVILFGMGGIGVELFKDFSIGLPPLNQVLAHRVIEETKIYEALSKGLRGKPPVDLRMLEEVVVRFSDLIVDFPEISEMDINPLAVSGGKFLALDARIIVDPSAVGQKNEEYSHLVILPYPIQYVMTWRLRDGTEVTLRPIRPEDEPMESEFIRGLSPETSRFRFFHVIKDLTHESLVRFCNIDYDREMAFVAETTKENRKIEIGVSRLIIEPNKRRGEIAIVIADNYQGKGLGKKLLDLLIKVAEEKGLESIYGIILPDNSRMVRLCKHLGFNTKYQQDHVFAELSLK